MKSGQVERQREFPAIENGGIRLSEQFKPEGAGAVF